MIGELEAADEPMTASEVAAALRSRRVPASDSGVRHVLAAACREYEPPAQRLSDRPARYRYLPPRPPAPGSLPVPDILAFLDDNGPG